MFCLIFGNAFTFMCFVLKLQKLKKKKKDPQQYNMVHPKVFFTHVSAPGLGLK